VRFAREHAALFLLLGCALLPRLATLRKPVEAEPPPHGEADERVFSTLVAQVREHPLAYTLRETPLLRRLDPHNYDRPIFFHPPAFVYLCAALTSVGLPLVLVPVLLDLAAIACVYLLALRLYGQREALLAAFLLATCVSTWFVSQHVWIDAMVVFSVALALVAADRAGRKGTPAAYALAGGAVALAFLSKVTAVLVAPAALVLALRTDPAALSPRKL
jgi:dolichyl-phosphate-mannose-protein mannosyltransferase